MKCNTEAIKKDASKHIYINLNHTHTAVHIHYMYIYRISGAYKPCTCTCIQIIPCLWILHRGILIFYVHYFVLIMTHTIACCVKYQSIDMLLLRVMVVTRLIVMKICTVGASKRRTYESKKLRLAKFGMTHRSIGANYVTIEYRTHCM